MKDNNKFKNKFQLLFFSLTIFILVSCGSYQPSSYDDDGIYSSASVHKENSKNITVSNNAKYYESVFSEPIIDYGQDDNNSEIFTDVDSYNSQSNTISPASTIESYGSWEDSDDNVTINVYSSPQPFYSSYWGWNNSFYNTSWGIYGSSWGWPYYGVPFGGYAYYGNPYYVGNFYRNYGYAYGRRGYASNAYYRRGYYGKRSTYGSSTIYRRGRLNGVYKNSPFRVSNQSRSRAYKGNSKNIQKRTSGLRSNANKRSRRVHNPSSLRSPKTNQRQSPRSRPRSVPRINNRSTPSLTPRSRPRSVPRINQRSSPRSSSRGYSRRGRG